MFKSLLVLCRKPGQDKPGVLNVVEAPGDLEVAQNEARKLAGGWQKTMPECEVWVHGPVRTSHCEETVNDGLLYKVA